MKIAIFSDLHGNEAAFQAILADIEKQKVDLTVCAGDAVNPFPGSKEIWLEIQRRNIPMVVGNHEQYVLSMVDPADPWGVQGKINFQSLALLTQSLSVDIITAMKQLPMTVSIPGPGGDDVLVCHASPSHTRRSFSQIMDDEMMADLSRYPHRAIAAGHIHQVWSKQWRDKLLFLCGGAGQPLEGDTRAPYAILTHAQGKWHLEHRYVRYDHAGMLKKMACSGFLQQGGPMAWLFYDELATAQKRILPFFKFIGQENLSTTVAGLQTDVRRYLESIDRWEYLAPFVASETI